MAYIEAKSGSRTEIAASRTALIGEKTEVSGMESSMASSKVWQEEVAKMIDNTQKSQANLLI